MLRFTVQVLTVIFDVVLFVLLLRIAMYHSRLLFNPFTNPIYRITEPILRYFRPFASRGRHDFSPHLSLLAVVIIRGVLFGMLLQDVRLGLAGSLYELVALIYKILFCMLILGALFPPSHTNWLIEFIADFTQVLLKPIPLKNRVIKTIIGCITLFFANTVVIYGLTFLVPKPAQPHSFLFMLTESALILELMCNFFMVIIIIGALLTWVSPNPYNPFVQIIWGITNAFLRPLQRIIPPLGGFDFTPIIAIVLLSFGSQIYLELIQYLRSLL